jgi:hypothetical protein
MPPARDNQSLKRAWQRVWAIMMGLAAWTLMARFAWLDRYPRERQQLAMNTAIAAFVLYLITIAYVMYLRSYARTPEPDEPAGAKKRRIGPMATWLGTIAILGAFGVSVGLLFPNVVQSFYGMLFVQTVTFGGVAAGLVFTMTGLPHVRRRAKLIVPSAIAPPPPPPAPPSFWSVALKVVAWQVGSVVVAGLLFGPVILLQGQFDRWIDIPACQRLCAAHGLKFESFVSGKSTYNCNCVGQVFHERAYLTGGHSFGACLVDWAFRAGTSMVVVIGWPAGLIALVVLAVARRKARVRR